MAILKAKNSSTIVYLKPVHIFGRDPSVADSILDSESCSRMHCVIRWQSGLWYITDESRNGCFINGERIEKGKGANIVEGDIISIGTDEDSLWVVENDNEPKPVLVCQEQNRFIELQTLNLLPNDIHPECQILQQGDDWLYESNQDFQLIKENFAIKIEGLHWTFHPNYVVQETKYTYDASEDIPKLTFNVSRNEEHIQILFEAGGKVSDLGHKTHHYLLLEMARHQLEDSTASKQELGWMSNDLLLNNMKIDNNHLNIQIYRAREAIRKYSGHWGQHLIERRRGEIRISPCQISINKESS